MFTVCCALPVLLSGSAVASAEPVSVEIEVAGDVPGFSQPQLANYLAQTMQKSAEPSWRFVAAQPGAASAPNRVVWSFKTLKVVWKGASHSGFPSAPHAISYLSSDVKLYLGGAYQMAMFTQSSVAGGPADRDLSDMVERVSHALFVENPT